MTVSKVLYIGPHKEDSDQGEICRGDIAAIHNDIDVVTRSIGRNDFKDPTWPSQVPDYDSKSLDGITHVIQYGYPDRWQRYGDYVHIGYLDIHQKEVSKEKWVNNLQMMDQVWCPENLQIYQIDRHLCKAELHEVPHAVDLDLYEKDYKISEIPQISGTYKFLCTSNSHTEKELYKVIESFFEEFDPTEPVSLIVIGDSKINDMIKSIKSELKLYKTDAYQKIVLTNKMTFAQKIGMFKYCDCFISKSTISPQDLSTRHAIACEKPVISEYMSYSLKENMRYAYKYKSIDAYNKICLFNKEFCGKVLGILNQ